MSTNPSEEEPQSTDHRFAFFGWEPSPENTLSPVPVTLLSGFLGAGKTSLLKHLLRQRPGGRFGLVINDVGDVNVDAEDLRVNFPESDDTIKVLRELTQGCICCSIQNDLADALVHLLNTSRPSHILIEASGVANPKNILQAFYSRNLVGHTLLDAFRITNVVTVIDTPSMLSEWKDGADVGNRKRIFLNDPRKPYFELIMEQIETCDVMVLNKLDGLSLAERQDVLELAKSLNPRADRVGSVQGEVDPAVLLDKERFNLEETQRGSLVHQNLLHAESEADSESHDHHDNHHDHHHDHQGYGLTTAVFRSRQPFDSDKFFKTLRRELPGLVRAKGFYWTSDRLDQCGMLSLAGGVVRADVAGPWFIDMLNRGRATLEKMPDAVRRAWQAPPIGDRRQELVFIGVGIDQEEIQAKLEACLDKTQ